MKDRNWFVQEVLFAFFFLFTNYITLPVVAQNYLKYCFCYLATLDYLFQKQEHLKKLT